MRIRFVAAHRTITGAGGERHAKGRRVALGGVTVCGVAGWVQVSTWGRYELGMTVLVTHENLSMCKQTSNVNTKKNVGETRSPASQRFQCALTPSRALSNKGTGVFDYVFDEDRLYNRETRLEQEVTEEAALEAQPEERRAVRAAPRCETVQQHLHHFDPPPRDAQPGHLPH
jgi:hypothetical protein